MNPENDIEAKSLWEHAKQAYRTAVGDPDGCSVSPDLNFKDCCIAHDLHYRVQNVTRAVADRELRECIRSKGWRVLPWIYWVAVRLKAGRRWDECAALKDLDV